MKKILFGSVAAAVLFFGCSDNSSKRQESVAKKSVQTEQKKAVAKIKSEDAVQKVQESPKEAVKEESGAVKEVAKNAVKTSSVSAEVLYKKCAGCHGARAEKKALGKSQIIRGWDTKKTEEALKGYLDGSYGGVMKGLMKSQLTGLKEKDIKVLSEYISKL